MNTPKQFLNTEATLLVILNNLGRSIGIALTAVFKEYMESSYSIRAAYSSVYLVIVLGGILVGLFITVCIGMFRFEFGKKGFKLEVF